MVKKSSSFLGTSTPILRNDDADHENDEDEDEDDDLAHVTGKFAGIMQDSKSFPHPPLPSDMTTRGGGKRGGKRGKGKPVAKLDHFLCFCTQCGHAFHAEHARMWFQGGRRRRQGGNWGVVGAGDGDWLGGGRGGDGDGGNGGQGEGEGKVMCPVPGCRCCCGLES